MRVDTNAPIVFICHCLSFPSFIPSIFIFINLLKPDVPNALKILFNLGFQVCETLMRRTKELHFVDYCSHKIKTFLMQNNDLYNINKNTMLFISQFSNIYI